MNTIPSETSWLEAGTGTGTGTGTGRKLLIHTWESAVDPVGSVLITHGYAEHGGRYSRLANDLSNTGYRVTAFDLGGHGRSSGPRAYVESFESFVDDILEVAASEIARHPDLPLILFGHSMGGALALHAVFRDASLFHGLILSSPALGTNQAPALQKIAGILSRIAPHLRTVSLNRNLLSHDTEYVADACSDPLNYSGRMPVRTGAELLRAMDAIRKDIKQLDVPILLIHGSEDELTDPDATCEFYERLASRDKTLALFDGFYHETFNELRRESVIQEITDWLDEHEPAKKPPQHAQ